MLQEFKAFLIKQNVLSLALAVILGVALNAVVTALVDQIIMPIVAVATPGGAWRTATWNVGPVKFGVGALAAAILNFFIVGLVAWRISKAFIRPEPAAAAPATKSCPFCRMADLDVNATRCPHCTSELGGVTGSLPPLASGASRGVSAAPR
jgi:large conductance mechanosensitive channel